MSASIVPSSHSQNPVQATRVRVFVDYWNFQLTMNDKESNETGQSDFRFKVDWRNLGPWLAKKACATLGDPRHSFEGTIIYSSYNSRTESSFRRWATTWLDRQPGIAVECLERKPKRPPKCPSCHVTIGVCPHCNQRMVATIEKGVDTLIATDMIRLAWEDAYDVAVLASSDSDLVPAVKFLNQKGLKVIQAGFPPVGVELATSCWASFDVFPERDRIRR